MLNLPKKTITLAPHINGRAQKHGEEHVPFLDLKLSTLLTPKQTVTLTGESHITDAWFKTEGGELGEPLLKDFAPYRMKGKFKDSLCEFTVGVNAKKIPMGNCTIKSLIFQPQDRGSTLLTCTVQAPATSKSIEILLWMGHQIEAKLQFGEMEMDENQEEMDLPPPNDDADDDDDDDAAE
ncbi:MAG TPA: hypothetical protein VK769_03550 [Verrucomicrobiae bacterium]|jgi:hypothetical protein|nr:hypothetical protein [Verrucomicrobiae bacterium]